jgi:hypothetical protein
MAFYPVDENTLINIDSIDSVKQRIVGGNPIVYIYVNNREYVIKNNVVEFLRMVRELGTEVQTWAGK